jgi:hypothetical protein
MEAIKVLEKDVNIVVGNLNKEINKLIERKNYVEVFLRNVKAVFDTNKDTLKTITSNSEKFALISHNECDITEHLSLSCYHIIGTYRERPTDEEIIKLGGNTKITVEKVKEDIEKNETKIAKYIETIKAVGII